MDVREIYAGKLRMQCAVRLRQAIRQLDSRQFHAMNLKDKVVQSIKWLFVAQICSQIVRTLITLVIIRGFDAHEMTYIALSQSIIGFFELFSTLRLSATIIRKKEVVKEDLQNVFGLMLIINLILFGMVFGGAELFSRFYDTPEVATILKVSSLSLLLVAVGYIPGTLLTKDMRFRLLSCIQVISGLGGALTAYLCARSGLGYWSLVWGGLSISAIGTILKIWFSPTVPWPKLSLKEAKENLSFGGFAIGESLAWYAFVTMDVVIAGKFWPAETLGFYAMAVQVVSMPLNRTLPLIKSVALPAFARSMTDDVSQLEAHTVKGMRLSMLLSVPMFWGAAAASALLVPVFLGEKWLPVILPMAFLSMGAPFRFLIELLSPAVVVVGKQRAVFRSVVLIALVMQLFYVIIVLNSSSPALLAAVWAFVYPALALYATYRYCRSLKIRFVVLMKAMLPVMASGLIMLGAVLLVIFSLADTIGQAPLLGLAVATGVLAFTAALFVMDRSVLLELLSITRGRKKA